MIPGEKVKKIFELSSKGYSYFDIARKLGISPSTVNNYLNPKSREKSRERVRKWLKKKYDKKMWREKQREWRKTHKKEYLFYVAKSCMKKMSDGFRDRLFEEFGVVPREEVLKKIDEIIRYRCEGCLADTGSCSCVEDKEKMLVELKNELGGVGE